MDKKRLEEIDEELYQAEEDLSIMPLVSREEGLLLYERFLREGMYREMYIRYGYDVKKRCKETGIVDPEDQIEEDGMMERLYGIALETMV